jgi:Ser/Thr protein kinase RdoA (MazF antagonist)
MCASRPSSEIVSNFSVAGKVIAIDDYGEGNINDTFIVRLEGGDDRQCIILQRINETVFPDPIATVKNSALVAAHIANKVSIGSGLVPILVTTRTGEAGLVNQAGQVWRAWTLLSGKPLTPVVSISQAFSMGNSLARFQQALLDFDSGRLGNTLPGFHDFGPKVSAFEKALKVSTPIRRRHADLAIEQTAEYVRFMRPIWAEIENQASSHPRVIHGDSKAENMLYDEVSRSCFLVDLDTVMTGSILVDFGDLARSGAATVSENEVATSDESIDLENLLAICDGYLSIARDFIFPDEIEILPIAGAAMGLVLAVRFLTDWLLGDKYFKINYPTHNLTRALGQLSIVESILEKRTILYRHVDGALSHRSTSLPLAD